jgi:hypothetical protein
VTSLNSKARIDQLETENERKDDRIARLETETDPDDTQELIEVRTDDEDPTLEDVWIAGLPFGNIIDAIETKVSGLSEVEERIDDLEARASSQPAESAESDEQDGSITPMERVLRAGEAGVLGHVTASVKRAKAIAEHFGQWAKKGSKNELVVRENLRTLLRTATGEDLAWKQVYRAGHALAKLSKGAIAFKKTRKYGWILVAQPDDHRLRSLLASGG